MNRQEFSKLLFDTRKASNCGTNELFRQSGIMPSQTRRIETASNNYNLKIVINYLQALNHLLKLSHNEEVIDVQTYGEISKFIAMCRKSENISQAQLAKKTTLSTTCIQKMEQQASVLSIDTFLLIATALNIEIKIV